ncbi:MAG: hypothetical protein E7578_03395 [Ruminococcaceae bacterium]|nr:hypothetical protein [Oscillospiraceae bacterium]
MENNQPFDAVYGKFPETRTVTTGDLTIIYDLLKNSENGRTFYSINICLHGSESVTIHDITNDPDLIYRIFDMICTGTVTPCCAFEVIEDLIESISAHP